MVVVVFVASAADAVRDVVVFVVVAVFLLF